MSEILKRKIEHNEEPDFSINEDDIYENLTTFVRGINEGERNRFLGIYAKYQDKGGAVENISKQK